MYLYTRFTCYFVDEKNRIKIDKKKKNVLYKKITTDTIKRKNDFLWKDK